MLLLMRLTISLIDVFSLVNMPRCDPILFHPLFYLFFDKFAFLVFARVFSRCSSCWGAFLSVALNCGLSLRSRKKTSRSLFLFHTLEPERWMDLWLIWCIVLRFFGTFGLHALRFECTHINLRVLMCFCTSVYSVRNSQYFFYKCSVRSFGPDALNVLFIPFLSRLHCSAPTLAQLHHSTHSDRGDSTQFSQYLINYLHIVPVRICGEQKGM